MQEIIENLSKEEVFGGIGSNSSPILDKPKGTIKINKILIGICIGGIIVYIFRDDIDDFFRKLLNKKSSDDVIISLEKWK